MCEQKDQEREFEEYSGHVPKVGDRLILPEDVYDTWIVTQVFDAEILKHLKDYTNGDIVFTIRPYSTCGVTLDKATMNTRTRITSLFELKYTFHTWETKQHD